MATKKRRSYEFDPEVGREIEKQAQKQQEIEDRRKKRIWIFWSLILSGAAIVSAAVLAFLFFLCLSFNFSSDLRIKLTVGLSASFSWHFLGVFPLV